MDPRSTRVGDLLDPFLAAYGHGREGYGSRGFVLALGPIRLPLPNPGRLPFHDLHHIAIGAGQDTWGEIQVSAFARRAFARDGYEATTVRAIAEEAGVPLARLHAEFPAKTSFGLAIYRELLHEVEETIGELPDAGVGARFAALVNFKLTRLDAHRPALLALVAAALDPAGPLGVLSDATAAIRSRMHGLVRVAVLGANDVSPAQGPALARTLYSLHLAIVLAWTQDPAGARALTALAAELLTAGAPMLPLADAHLQRFDAAFSPHLGSDDRAHTLLERLFRRRRVLPGVPAPDDAAFAPHLAVVQAAITRGAPLTLVLPAFPAKAPNPHKVLGALPALAEELALRSLRTLVEELSEAHPVELLICSDGLVFADIVAVPDADILAYGAALDGLIAGTSLRRFDLADAWGPVTPPEARARLLAEWAEPRDELEQRVRASPPLAALLDGLHRFLFEDRVVREPDRSRTQVRASAREDAWELLRRSLACGRPSHYELE